MRARRVVAWVDRVNAAQPWSHNDWYGRWVVRQVPRGARRALDVGCGTGTLVRRLSSLVPAVDGIDADPAAVRLARAGTAGLAGVRVECRDLRALPPVPAYDVVTAVAVVHHVPTDAALGRLRALLRPGGRLVVVGCYRQVGWRDRLVDVLAVPANLVIGLTRRRHAATARVAMSAPVATATDTLDDVRRAAAAELGTYRLRRRVFWRYTLTHTEP